MNHDKSTFYSVSTLKPQRADAGDTSNITTQGLCSFDFFWQRLSTTNKWKEPNSPKHRAIEGAVADLQCVIGAENPFHLVHVPSPNKVLQVSSVEHKLTMGYHAQPGKTGFRRSPPISCWEWILRHPARCTKHLCTNADNQLVFSVASPPANVVSA